MAVPSGLSACASPTPPRCRRRERRSRPGGRGDRGGLCRPRPRRLRQRARRAGVPAAGDVPGRRDRLADPLYGAGDRRDLRAAARGLRPVGVARAAARLGARHAAGRVGARRAAREHAHPIDRSRAARDRRARVAGRVSGAITRARLGARGRHRRGAAGGGRRNSGPADRAVHGVARLVAAHHQGQSPGVLSREPGGDHDLVLVGGAADAASLALLGAVPRAGRVRSCPRHGALHAHRSAAIPAHRVRDPLRLGIAARHPRIAARAMVGGTRSIPVERTSVMSVKRHQVGPRMSQAVVHGNTVYLAGQVAGDEPTTKAQTEAVLKKIDALLASAGTNKSNLLSATVYLADMKTYDQMNAAWDAWVDPVNTPARATVEAKLAQQKFLVEISVVAAI